MKHPYLGALIVILLSVSIFTFIYAAQFKKLTTSKVILQTFSDSDIYNQLPKMVDEAFKSAGSKPDQAIIFKAVSIAIEPTYLRTQLETNLPPFINYLNNKTKTLSLNIDLKPFKNNFSVTVPNNLASVVADSIENLPKCETSQATKSGEIPSCQDGNTAEISAQAQAIASTFNYKDFLNGIPDTFKFSDSNNSQAFNSAKKAFRTLNIIFIATAALSVILLLILFLMGLPKLASAFRWTGIAMVIPSGVHLFFSIIGKASINPLLSACVSKTNPDLGNILKPVVNVFANKFFMVSILYAGIVFLVGIILIIVSFIINSTHSKGQNVQPNTSSR